MKTSIYNISLKLEDNSFIIYNTYSGAMVRLSNNEYKNILFLDKNDTDKLVKNKILVDKNLDELKKLEKSYLNVKADTNTLSLTIAPILECNFKCSYCYEGIKKGVMSNEVQLGIIEFVKTYIKNGIKTLSITWYGGEPLIAINIIEELSKAFMMLCDKNNIKYVSKMVSNFYLANEDIINRLIDIKINMVQVTLDGDEERNDTFRILLNGKGTFKNIVENIKVAKLKGLPIKIRSNINKRNSQYINNFIVRLKEEGLSDIPVYLGHMSNYNETCNGIADICLSKEEFADISYKFLNQTYKAGFKYSLHNVRPKYKPIYCGAIKNNSYVIDPEGSLYKCWHNIGISEKVIGNIRNIKYIKETVYKNPFTNTECKRCNVLPLCMGGCPDLGLNSEHVNCEQWKYNIELLIKKYYKVRV